MCANTNACYYQIELRPFALLSNLDHAMDASNNDLLRLYIIPQKDY